jgi:gamma-glutamyltranspeptidase/glutathione hydrolase
MHQRFGKLPWKDLFQAAIAFAEQGYPVHEGMHEIWSGANVVRRMKLNAESAHVFLPNGKAPQTGDVFKNPDMARALRLIAEQGPDAFYKGEIATAILKTSQQLGGTMTAKDLASFSSLEMLNIMQTKPPSPLGPLSPVEMHKRIEAMKLAYSDVHRYDADPRTYHAPVEQLLSKEYAQKRAALIDPGKANCRVTAGDPVGSNTTYLTVVDKEGNIASWIQSVYDYFGSRVTVDGLGFVLQNRGTGFTLNASSPNVLAGGKRPFHTIIPAFMERGDEHVGFGIMGEGRCSR